MSDLNLRTHWDKVYGNNPIEKLGWYEENPEPSLGLIKHYLKDRSSSILNVGSGASTLVDALLKEGYNNIIATDLSQVALSILQKRLEPAKDMVRYIADDLINPLRLHRLDPVDLWHDRAVLHFFNTEIEIQSYFTLLSNLLKPMGIAIIATFNLRGAKRCSGLPVFRYDQQMLQERLGRDFVLQEAFDHTYTMPSGDTREYVYAVFRKSA
ncbi:MAG TPA: class I SAM-dependent methyltransferase [Bacteroidales bacterium]|nr:class I SAM-dependent methyltransferase [Bacteroidales bacterium]